MIHIHASGHLLKDPQERQTKTGGTFVTCMLVADDTVVNIAAFDEDLVALLLKLKKGDGLSVTGKASVATYTDRNGETKASVSITANRVLSGTVEAKARRTGARPGPANGWPKPDGRPFDDAIQF